MFIWTCGGGGGGGDTPTEPGPSGPGSPSVQDIQVTTNEDVSSVITLNGTDPGNKPLTFSVSVQPTNGSFSLSGNTGTYTPNENFNGSDEFTFFASNGTNNSNTGKVLITINPVNDDPTSIDVSVTTDEDNTITFELQANEYDGDTIVFQIDEQVTNGQLTLSGSSATYTPNQNWFGVDTFKFSVYDSNGKSMLKSGNGTIVVNALNDPPSVNDIYDIEVPMGEVKPVKLNAFDVDSYSVSFQIVDQPNNGTVTVSNDTAYISPLDIGSDSFTFEAFDGTSYSDPGSVFLDIYDEGYTGHFIQIVPQQVGDVNYRRHGVDFASTKLNNGNFLIAAATFSYERNNTTFEYFNVQYEPITLAEINSNYQVVNRYYLDSISLPVSDVHTLKQLSNGNIIIVSSFYDGNGVDKNVYGHMLDSNYNVILDDSTPETDYLFYERSQRIKFQNLKELPNGNIFYFDRLYDANFELITKFESEIFVSSNNLLSYKPARDENNYENQILVYDFDGNLENTVSFDSNRELYIEQIHETNYGHIGFGHVNSQTRAMRFDSNFSLLSYSQTIDNSDGTHFNDYFWFKDDNGFTLIGDGFNSNYFKKLDENGNLLFETGPNYSSEFSNVLRFNEGSFIKIGGNRMTDSESNINANQILYFNASNDGSLNTSTSHNRLHLKRITNQGNRID